MDAEKARDRKGMAVLCVHPAVWLTAHGRHKTRKNGSRRGRSRITYYIVSGLQMGGQQETGTSQQDS